MKTLDLTNLRFAPDADYTNPQVLFSVTNMRPTVRGSYAPSYGLVATNYAGAVTASLGASILKRSDGSVGVYVGTTTKLFEADGVNAWTDRSKGGGYTGTATSWQFAVYGTVTIATNNVDTPQFVTGAGAAFADLTGAPKAKCIAVMANAVMLGNYDNGTRFGDGWYASDTGNYATWTATPANSVASGRLTDTPGPITAMATLNDTVIAWKNRGMYLGRFVGGDTIWSWQLLNADVGCVAPDAWVHTDAGIVFVSERDVFLYDGGSIRPIGGADIRRTLFSGASYDNQSYIKLTYEPAESMVYVFVNISGTTNGCDRAFLWNHQSGKWGNAGRGAGHFGNTTFGYVVTVFRNPNYADLVARGFGTNSAKAAALVIENSFAFATCFSGLVYLNAEFASITTGVVGKPDVVSTLSRVIPTYLGSPPSGTDALSIASSAAAIALLGDSNTGTWDATRYRFDCGKGGISAKFFQLTHTTTGEVSAYQLQYGDAGSE